MIDNTASIETGSLSPQTKATVAHEVKIANISETKTETAETKEADLPAGLFNAVDEAGAVTVL